MSTMSPTTRRNNKESLDRSEREANQIKEALMAGADRAGQNTNNNEDSNGNKNIKKEGQVGVIFRPSSISFLVDRTGRMQERYQGEE